MQRPLAHVAAVLALLAALLASALVAGFALVGEASRALGAVVSGSPGSPPLPALPESSVILADSGRPIAYVHGGVDRRPVPFSALPKDLVDAVVAVEDHRYWQEGPLDVPAAVRAALADLVRGRVVEGGSTIPEQYAKLLVAARHEGQLSRTLAEKLRELVLASRLARRMSRRELLAAYLNAVPLGPGIEGVEAASVRDFGTSVSHLDLAQAALLAGLIEAPTADDPFLHPGAARRRRAAVLERMVALHMVSPTRAAAAERAPLVSPPPPEPDLDADFVAHVEHVLLEDPALGPTVAARRRLLEEGGLRVTTTLDPARQAAAASAIAHVLVDPGRDPSAALVSVNPATGAVEALVGGERPGPPGATFDLATEGRRPAGSTFKPFVLAEALEQGISPGTVFDAPSSIVLPLPEGTWQVHNYPGEPTGPMTLATATIDSVNTVYAPLVLRVGPARVVELARRMGVASPLAPYPSAALGADPVSALDLAAAYATFADGGVAHRPYVVAEVRAADGRVLERHRVRGERVLPPAIAAEVVSVLEQVVEQGTGVKARIGRPAAGKTGTGEHWEDAWFVGFTPQLSTAVWVGFPQGEIPMVPPRTRILVEGGTWPAEIWQLYDAAALASVPAAAFPQAPTPPPPATVAQALVPDLVGIPVADAAAEAESDGYLLRAVPVPSPDYPPSYVVAQDPAAGTPRSGGSTITVSVSTGASAQGPLATVPNVLGLAAGPARSAIEAAGLTPHLEVVAEPPGPGAASRAGRVWEQSPPAGSTLPRGAVVSCSVDPGPPSS